MYNYDYDELEQLRIENKILKETLQKHRIKYSIPRPKEISVSLMSMNEIVASSIKTWRG